MRPELSPSTQRLLAVRLDNIGDVVMLGPSLRAFRAWLPGSRITLLVSPAGARAATMLPWVDECLVLRAVWQDISGKAEPDAEAEYELVAALAKRAFDAALIFTSFSQSPYPPAYVCYLAGIPLRAAQSREFGGALLTHWIRPLPDDAHQVDRNLHLVESLGVPAAGRHLELHVGPEDRHAATLLLMEAGLEPGDPFIVFAPGASCAARRYSPARMAEAARLLVRETGLPFVVAGAERDAAAAEPLLRAGGRSLIGRDTLPRLAAILSRASLLVANNSGPMHLADAAGCPAVILYSGTELLSQWRPRYAPVRLLRREVSCSPCYRFECPYAMECLDVPPEEIAAAAIDLLGERSALRPRRVRVPVGGAA